MPLYRSIIKTECALHVLLGSVSLQLQFPASQDKTEMRHAYLPTQKPLSI